MMALADPAGADEAWIEPLDGVGHPPLLAALHAPAFVRPWSQADFSGLLAEPGIFSHGLFVGRKTRALEGFALSRRVLDEAELLTVAIAAPLRGRGLGGTLVRDHLAAVLSAGVLAIHLEVGEGNAPALALYGRLGFRPIGRRPGYYPTPDGGRAGALTMRLDAGAYGS